MCTTTRNYERTTVTPPLLRRRRPDPCDPLGRQSCVEIPTAEHRLYLDIETTRPAPRNLWSGATKAGSVRI